MTDLAHTEPGRNVVQYDQFGVGRSSRRPEWDPSTSINDRFAAILAELGDDPDAADKLGTLFGERHMCRVPMTPELIHTFTELGENPVVRDALNGPDSDQIGGALRGWTSIDRLSGLSVPTLVLAGEFDELSLIAWQPFVDGIAGARLHVFAGASHVPFIESREEYVAVLGDFLARTDS